MQLPSIDGIIGTFGFFLMVGAGGGIEQDTLAWGPGLGLIALGLLIMWGAVLHSRRTR